MKQKYMKRCLELARESYNNNEVPVGCVIVRNNKIIAEGTNKKHHKKDPTGHAEIEAIVKAAKHINDWRLENCDLYVNLEPCIMCGGAIYQSRIENVYYGSKNDKGGCFHSNIHLLDIEGLNHYPNVVGGIMEKESEELIKEFFKEKRIRKKQ